VGSDRDAEGFAHAGEYGIPTFSVALASFADRDAWAAELLANVRMWNPDLVVLSGFMKLLPPSFVAALGPRIINTHPAHLPEFPGAHAVRDTLAAGATQTGASVIVVDDGVDSGPVVVQERIAVDPDDTEASLHERIKVVERRLLVGAIRDIAEHRIRLEELT
jgi:phosphoribosylglycinamide formyltransferase-1